MTKTQGKGGRKAILGAAVLRALLGDDAEPGREAERELYRGVLRDLQLSDEEVARFLSEHQAEVATALRAHGRPEP